MTRALPLLLGCSLLASCSLFSETFNRPVPEEPVDEGESYLSVGDGPQATVDLGPGQKTLMESFVAANTANAELRRRVEDLEAELAQTRSSLEQSQEEHRRAQTHGAGAEAELQRQRDLLADRETKILNLTLEKARLEQEVLKLRIASLQNQLDGMAGGAAPSGPNGGH